MLSHDRYCLIGQVYLDTYAVLESLLFLRRKWLADKLLGRLTKRNGNTAFTPLHDALQLVACNSVGDQGGHHRRNYHY
jgi:hypothetical protein